MLEQGKDKHNLYERALAKIRDNTDGAWGKLLAPVVPKFPSATPAKLLQEARADAERRNARHVGADLAKKAPSTLTLEHVKEYLHKQGAPHDKALGRAEERDAAKLARDAILDSLFKDTRVLQEVYKKAKLRDPKITREQVKKHKGENLNLEKRPTKFNSWVANHAKDEYQADLLFFDDLRARDESGRERVEYYAGLMLADPFSKKLTIAPMPTKSAEDIIKIGRAHV